MSMAAFDSIGYMRKLEASGVPRQQAEVQADTLRQALERVDEAQRKELATKADVRESELRLQKEIETVRKDIEHVKYDMLKWQLGIGLAIIVIMAKGFGWLGF